MVRPCRYRAPTRVLNAPGIGVETLPIPGNLDVLSGRAMNAIKLLISLVVELIVFLAIISAGIVVVSWWFPYFRHLNREEILIYILFGSLIFNFLWAQYHTARLKLWIEKKSSELEAQITNLNDMLVREKQIRHARKQARRHRGSSMDKDKPTESGVASS